MAEQAGTRITSLEQLGTVWESLYGTPLPESSVPVRPSPLPERFHGLLEEFDSLSLQEQLQVAISKGDHFKPIGRRLHARAISRVLEQGPKDGMRVAVLTNSLNPSDDFETYEVLVIFTIGQSRPQFARITRGGLAQEYTREHPNADRHTSVSYVDEQVRKAVTEKGVVPIPPIKALDVHSLALSVNLVDIGIAQEADAVRAQLKTHRQPIDGRAIIENVQPLHDLKCRYLLRFIQQAKEFEALHRGLGKIFTVLPKSDTLYTIRMTPPNLDFILYLRAIEQNNVALAEMAFRETPGSIETDIVISDKLLLQSIGTPNEDTYGELVREVSERLDDQRRDVVRRQ